MEGTDIRDVTAEDIGGQADFICVDVSFISLTKILPKVYELLKDGASAAVLIKPQFEAGRSDIGKRGIVKDRKVHIRVLSEIDSFASSIGFVLRKIHLFSRQGRKRKYRVSGEAVQKRGESCDTRFQGADDSAFTKL